MLMLEARFDGLILALLLYCIRASADTFLQHALQNQPVLSSVRVLMRRRE
jgi:hypothetical protein